MLDTLETKATGRAAGVPPADGSRPERQERLQRSTGAVAVSFKLRGSRTVLDRVRQSGCGKARFPRPEPGRLAEAILLNTSGGLTDGDIQTVEIAWGEGTRAAVATQAAERIYRSRGAPAEVITRLDVADGATALWLPQETIQFDGGRVRRRLDVALAETAWLVACESTVFGRTAMGERVHGGLLEESWRIRRGGRLVFADGLRLDGDLDRLLDRPAIAGGARAIATLLCAAPDAAALVDPVREALAGDATRDGQGGASAVDDVLAVRLLNSDGAGLRRALLAVLETLLAHLPPEAGCERPDRPPALPRVWSL